MHKTSHNTNDWTSVPQNSIVHSSEYSLMDARIAAMHIQAALDTTTAHTGTRFVVQTSASESGDEDWQDLVEFVALIGTAATDAIEDDPLAAGSTDIALTGHAAFNVLGRWRYIKDATLANSELVRQSATDTDEISILDGTTNAHVVTTPMWNIAMVQNISLPSSALRARLVLDNTVDDNGSTIVYKMRITKTMGV